MPQAFLQVAIPVLYVYDEGVVPPEPPGFDMGLLPVVSRVLKDHAGTPQVTVVTGAPAPAAALESAFTHLALQYPNLRRASPEAGNLIVAEFIADNFDAEAVLDHLKRLVEERQRQLAEEVENLPRRGARRTAIEPEGGEGAVDASEAEESVEEGSVEEGSDEEPAGDESKPS